jgi:hypothetical protein
MPQIVSTGLRELIGRSLYPEADHRFAALLANATSDVRRNAPSNASWARVHQLTIMLQRFPGAAVMVPEALVSCPTQRQADEIIGQPAC